MSFYQNGPIPPHQYPYSPIYLEPETGIYRIAVPTVVPGSSVGPPFGLHASGVMLYGRQPSPFRQVATPLQQETVRQVTPPPQQETVHPHALLNNPCPTAGLELVPCVDPELSPARMSFRPIYFTVGGCVGLNMDLFMRGVLRLDFPDEKVFEVVGDLRRGGSVGFRWPGYAPHDVVFKTHIDYKPLTREQLARLLCKMSKKFLNQRKHYQVQRGCEKWEVLPSEKPFVGKLRFRDVTLVALRHYYAPLSVWIPEFWVRVL